MRLRFQVFLSFYEVGKWIEVVSVQVDKVSGRVVPHNIDTHAPKVFLWPFLALSSHLLD